MDVMAKQRDELGKLLGELSAFQAKITGGTKADQNEAEAMDAKAQRAEELQKELEAHDARTKRFGDLQANGARLTDPVLPPEQPARKAEARDDVVGYMTLGDYVVANGGLQKWAAEGRPKIPFTIADVPQLLRHKREGTIYVGLNQKTLNVMHETKAVPTIGANVITPQLIPGLVRVTEHDQLVLRDILNVVPTNSDTVYWPRLNSFTRAADRTAHGAVKPEAAAVLSVASASVDTIAAHIPVHNQQLEDLPSLAGLINGELLYDLDKRVEELVMWGDGVTSNFLGFAQDPLIQAMRAEVGDELIDTLRRGITDVRRSGYQPNYFLVDPLDWETIVLTKGTDDHYVWVVVTDGATQRLWGVNVVETVACEDTMDTMARVIVVGDFRVGATLYDRMQSQISVGWIDDQFIRNMRTILAELRAAWAIRRPDAFRVLETVAGTS